MRFSRLFVTAVLLAVAACSPAGDEGASPSPAASAAGDATTAAPTSAPTETEAETADEATESEPAADASAAAFFELSPRPYEFAALPKRLQKQVTTQFASIPGPDVVEDVEARYLEKGSVPVATMLVITFNEKVTAGYLSGVVKGIEQSAGAKGKPATVGGKEVTFIAGNPPSYVYVADDYVLLFAGPRRQQLEPAAAAVLKSL